jgi:hypothetical protein
MALNLLNCRLPDVNHRQPFAMLTQDLLGHETAVTRNEVLAHRSSPRLQECFGSGEAPSGRASPRPPAAASAAASPTPAGADDRSWRDPSQRTTAHSAWNLILGDSSRSISYQRHPQWHIELFFKSIKQNLRIRHFYGTSENAVKTQIWTTVCIYVLAAIVKKELALDVSLDTFLQVLSVHSFERIPILQTFSDGDSGTDATALPNQLNLFNT